MPLLERDQSVEAPRPPPPVRAPGEDGLDEKSLAPVLTLLSKARARQARILHFSAAFLCLAGVLVATPAVLALAAAGWSGARALGAGLVLLAFAAYLVGGPLRARRRAGDLHTTARLLAGRVDSATLRRGLVPAYELGAALSRGEPVDFSRTLARAHIDSVAAAARRADLAKALPSRPLRLAAKALVAACAFLLFALVAFRAPLSRGASALFARQQPQAKSARVVEPITGEIQLTYVYPSYTRLPTRTVPNTNGEISAPRGTQVKLETRADREVGKASLLVGKSELPMQVEGGRDLAGELLVNEPGSYRFRFESARGRMLAEGPPIPIAVEADAAPKAEIVAPATDIEVDPKSEVTLRFEAEDDYGLSEIALMYKLPGATKPKRVVLQRDPETPRRGSGEYRWDVVALGLMAGDRVAYYIEATDNDQISGAKTGVSRTQYLKIYSQAEHHRQIIQQIEEDWEKLISLLADRLEGRDRAQGRSLEDIAGFDAVDARALALAAALGERAASLRKTKAPDQLWRALVNVSQGLRAKASATSEARAALGIWVRRGIGLDSSPVRRFDAALAAEIAEEERSILYLETLLDQQRIEDLLALSKELAAKRRDLANLLEQYRTAPNDETRDRLISEIARLKERMAELMQRMAELTKNISDDHVNAEALKELSETGQMMDSFDKIQELLHQGEVEEAMKEMEKLGQMLDELEKGLQEASGKFEGGEMAELGRELQQFARELDELQRDQQSLLEGTQQVRNSYKQALEERLKQKGADFVKRLREKVAEAEKKLGEVTEVQSFFGVNDLRGAREAVSDLDKALAVEDFDQAAQAAAKALAHAKPLAEDFERQARESRHFPQAWKKEAETAQRNAKHAREAIAPLEEVRKELAELFPPPTQMMSEADKQKMKDLGEREGELQQKASQMMEKMGQMNQQAPIFSPEAQQMMRQAGDRMGKAQRELRGRNPTGAIAEQRAALDQIGQLKKGLEQGQKQGGGQGPGIPWPWMGPGMGRDSGAGMSSSVDEKVQIPGADQYQVPEEYRKDILDAMKQRAPEKYEDQVRRYYEEIVK